MIYSRNIFPKLFFKLCLQMLLALTLLSSCSYLESKREPAAAGSSVVQSQDEILEVLEFRLSDVQDQKKDYSKKILDYISEYKTFGGVYTEGNEVAVNFVEDSTLPKGVAYWPEFNVKDNVYRITVLHSKEAIHDGVASAELFNFLTTLRDTKYFMSHFAAFEMFYNAIEQDAVAAQNWAKVREAAAKAPPANIFSEDEIIQGLAKRADEWTKEKEDYTAKAEESLKLQRKLDKERRAIIDALDKAPDEQQFKNLVAKNDRKGVAALLKKYLPWEQMAPFEKKYWETYLDVIQNPLPMEKRILIYRGIDDDFIYSAYDKGVEIDKDVAKKEGKVFVMSTIMTKNQGTWNRRLRSLTAMNEKFIGTNPSLSDEFTKSARIMTMFVNHSQNPQGSPFLSFTPKFGVAQQFGAKKMSAHALDPRLISFNFASKYKNEVEFLLPLVTFPEDVVAFYDASIHTDMSNNEDQIKKLFKAKLTEKHGESKGSEIYEKVLKNSEEYFDAALNRYQGKKTGFVESSEPNFLVKFFNKIFSKKTVAPAPAKPVSSTACMDIISSFWK